jgi:2-polyprenyl-3-methyl-5-hydroxy-6-metoxy-1,4-benzoquinol methylase
MKTITNCPVCDKTEFRSYISTKDFFFTKEDFNIDICANCNFIFTNPIPADLGKYYETEDYLSHKADDKSMISRIYRNIRNINIKNKFKIVSAISKGKKILDIGCGTGELLAYFKTKGYDALGIEPSKDAREFAQQKHNIEVKEESYIKNIADNSFDIVSMWHVLEHVSDLNGRMKDLKRISKDDATIVIAVPNVESPDSKHYGMYWAGLDVPRHLYHFSKASMTKLAQKHNMKITSTIPMKFDSYYVSMLSEKYKDSSLGIFKAVIEGFISNLKAKKANNYSSMIFVLKKNSE